MKFKQFGKKVYCNECLGGAYGFVNKVWVVKLKKHVYICDECETVWESFDDLANNNHLTFDEFAKKYNLKPLWSEFSNVDEEWYIK